MTEIRALRADEVEVAPQKIEIDYMLAVLYKDARCDMKLLDEHFGLLGWQRKHMSIDGKMMCVISVWDDERKCWVERMDVGIPSSYQKEKGEASDSFKRASTNFGIGRELYTAPPILINLDQKEVKTKEGRNGQTTYSLAKGVEFRVAVMDVDASKNITKLIIVDKSGIERFAWEAIPMDKKIGSNELKIFYGLLEKSQSDQKKLLTYISNKFYKTIKKPEDMTMPQYIFAVKAMSKKIEEAEKASRSDF
ncbi:hypothetical protein [Angelakisella massiliensis]|uniref:hypothetical protein n=1 Tax=Angelakisella massiliensis TaxID=1871018 RepID=UPI0023A8E07D|nr:hypothetical protein [Angelakisella massiliensis]